MAATVLALPGELGTPALPPPPLTPPVGEKIVRAVQGPNPQASIYALKTVLNLARSDHQLASMRAEGLVKQIVELTRSPHEALRENAVRTLDTLMTLSSDGLGVEFDAENGLAVLVKLCSDANAAVSLQAYRVLVRYSGKTVNKKVAAEAILPLFLSGFGSKDMAIEQQAAAGVYYLLGAEETHAVFAANEGVAKLLLALPSATSPTLIWVAAAVCRLARNDEVFRKLEDAGLRKALDALATNPAATVMGIAAGGTSLREQVLEMQKKLQPFVEKEERKAVKF